MSFLAFSYSTNENSPVCGEWSTGLSSWSRSFTAAEYFGFKHCCSHYCSCWKLLTQGFYNEVQFIMWDRFLLKRRVRQQCSSKTKIHRMHNIARLYANLGCAVCLLGVVLLCNKMFNKKGHKIKCVCISL